MKFFQCEIDSFSVIGKEGSTADGEGFIQGRTRTNIFTRSKRAEISYLASALEHQAQKLLATSLFKLII